MRHLEYPLYPDHELHTEGDALHVEGVGWLGQYHSYLDKLWEHALPYFVRDIYSYDLQKLLDAGNALDHRLVCSINTLNSKIRAHERNVANQPLATSSPAAANTSCDRRRLGAP